MVVLITWLIAQGLIAKSEFYTVTNAIPPRLVFFIVPTIILIAILFNTSKGKAYIDSLNIKTLAILHIVRIPVEIVLYWLSLHKAIPELMTFAGRNFDILAGITAPVAVYFGFNSKKINRKMLLLWNFIALGLLLNIVINAVLSAPFSFQQFAFDQPNIAILYFPFVLLPAFIVPVVLFGHLVSIRQLTRK